MDELVDSIISGAEDSAGLPAYSSAATPEMEATTSGAIPKFRERLAALAAGGKARKFLGREYTAPQIDEMAPDEVERLYGRYQARLGAQIAESLGESLIGLYCHVASRFLPIDNTESLAQDLKSDAFLGAALGGVCCELYHRFGSYLAPLSAAVTTAKHLRIRPPAAVEYVPAPDGLERYTSGDACYAFGMHNDSPDTPEGSPKGGRGEERRGSASG